MLRKLCLMVLGTVLPGTAQAAWQQATSTHFVVYSDDTADHVKAFTVQLERYDKAMHVMRGLDEGATSPSSRVTVFIVKNVDAVQRLIGRSAGDVAGFYVPRAAGSVAFIPRSSGDGSRTALTAQQVLLHEYAHHVTFSTWGHAALPAWFVEGFAEFNATASFDASGGMTFGAPPLYRAYGMLKTDEVPFRKLISVDPNTLPDDERSIFYGRAWLLTHYLAFDAARRKQLSDYIGKINEGQPALKAASVFGDPRKLDSELDKYVLRPRLPAITLKPEDLPIGSVAVRSLTPAEAATMPALIQSKRGVDAKAAPAVLNAARTAAGAFPVDPFALNELAEAEYDAGHYAESQAAATRAMAADPRSIHALMYRGMAQMATATKAKDHDPASWQQVRHWFSAANHLDPDDPWPLVMYYQTYRAAGQPPTANAQTGLLYAHELAPFDPGLGLTAADVYLHQEKLDLAKATLKPVAFNPHAGSYGAIARSALAAFDTGGAPAGLAILDGKNDQASAKADS